MTREQELRDDVSRLLQQNAEVREQCVSQIETIARLRAALIHARGIISEAAMTGFNCKDGNWPERLFASQGITHDALNQQHSDDR